MRVYLKVVNPTIALIVFALCFWAATFEKGEFNVHGIVVGNLNTYFFAKGLFSASTVFIVGKILLEIVSRRETRIQPESKKTEVLYCLALTGLALSLLTGLFLHMELGKSVSETIVSARDPEELRLVEHYRLKESRILRINGKLKNNSDRSWRHVRISAKVFFGDRYANTCDSTTLDVGPAVEFYFTIKCDEFDTKGIDNDIRYVLQVEGTRGVK